MILYVIAFLAGGYLIPASMHFCGVWAAESNAPDHPSWEEKFVTSMRAALTWPCTPTIFEVSDDYDDDDFEY